MEDEVDKLIKQLNPKKYKDETRRAAVNRLGEIGDSRAVLNLRFRAKYDLNKYLRKEAEEALDKICERAIRNLNSPDPNKRFDAVRTISLAISTGYADEDKKKEYAEFLKKKIFDVSIKVSESASETLINLVSYEGMNYDVVSLQCDRLLRGDDTIKISALNEIRSALVNGGSPLRFMSLAQILLTYDNPKVRFEVVNTLGYVRGPEQKNAVSYLTEALKDGDWSVRRGAVDALGYQFSEEKYMITTLGIIDINSIKLRYSEWSKAQSLLNGLALKDPNSSVRMSAIRAIDVAITKMRSTRPVTWFFFNMADEVGPCVNTLIKALSDTDENVRRTAAESLLFLKSPHFGMSRSSLLEMIWDKKAMKAMLESAEKYNDKKIMEYYLRFKSLMDEAQRHLSDDVIRDARADIKGFPPEKRENIEKLLSELTKKETKLEELRPKKLRA
ncbi:HEAT repeat domain-containing protein [Candidatus Micrarchaeota archaeon]|nr:HEAT repeat domain-containing protein [Candidatus Micrarchaeota archaeon]